ncbi:MAG: ATPase [Rhodobacteraceae bacterium]|nr:ATPase [Paracoccaceae bacterium]
MYYGSAKEWLQAEHKQVMLFGMSGVGKTHVSNMLRNTGDWYHYSVDYRIGTRYLGEYIVDNFKLEAMKNDFLAKLLKSDSIYIGSNITFNNLDPLSTYIGKLGAKDQGGLSLDEFIQRQEIHCEGEIRSLEDTKRFICRAQEIYGYKHFVCDTGGSICEILDPFDKNNKLMSSLAECMLPIWLEATEDQNEELLKRFAQKPKPMYYPPDFISKHLKDVDIATLNPDEFSSNLYKELIKHRIPRYEAMAKNWGITIDCRDVSRLESAEEFDSLVADAIDKKVNN